MKKQTILLVLSIIFLGIFIAKYSNNYREEIPLAIGSNAEHRGFILPSGWSNIPDHPVACLVAPTKSIASGYPFVRSLRELDCGSSERNQTAVVFNTVLSFGSSALIVYGLFGAIKGYRQYRVALRQHYQ